MSNKGGAPIGNNNAGKNKRWSAAIDKALKQYNEGDVKAGHALDRIAYKLVHKAITTEDNQEFDKAIAVIGDRIEGKPSQSVALTGHLSTSEMSTEDLIQHYKELNSPD